MVQIDFNGTLYSGRLISIQAIEDIRRTYINNHYEDVYENVGYDLTLMDAFGAVIYLQIKDLNTIQFV